MNILLGPGIQPPGQRLATNETETSSLMMSSGIESSINVTYFIDDEELPCQGKIAKSPTSVVLADFKKIIGPKYQRHKFFFKNKDDEFGIVKREIADNQTPLPLFDGRIVSWLVATEGSMISEGGLSGLERGPGVGQTRPPSFHGPRSNVLMQDDPDEDTESAITSVSQQAANMRSRRNRMPNGGNHRHHGRGHGPPPLPGKFQFIFFGLKKEPFTYVCICE